MDMISLALALKALKKTDINATSIQQLQNATIQEVEDLNITEAETGVYKVNGRFYVYSGDQLLNLPNVTMDTGVEISMIVIISKYVKPNTNQVIWDWFVISGANNQLRYGSTTKTTDPNTEAITYSGIMSYAETANKRVNAITNDNKADIYKYPSVKAVVDYVDSVLADIVDENY